VKTRKDIENEIFKLAGGKKGQLRASELPGENDLAGPTKLRTKGPIEKIWDKLRS